VLALINHILSDVVFYTFFHFKRRFLYNENYIKIIYYITLMNNEELIKEISILKAELEKTKFELVETKEHLKSLRSYV